MNFPASGRYTGDLDQHVFAWLLNRQSDGFDREKDTTDPGSETEVCDRCAGAPLFRHSPEFISARAVFHSRPRCGMEKVMNCMDNPPEVRICSVIAGTINQPQLDNKSAQCKKIVDYCWSSMNTPLKFNSKVFIDPSVCGTVVRRARFG
jgi:hypothetical protein